MKRNVIRWMLMILLAGSLLVSSSFAKEAAAAKPSEKIPRPEGNSYISDILNLIDPLNEEEINSILGALEEENGVPLYVVVIPSLPEVGYENSRIEDVAVELMEAWNISPKTLDGKPWDRGVLFLISRDNDTFDFRIETGKGWGTDLDKPALRVLQQNMRPNFDKRKFSLGLTRSIHSLEAAIRKQTPTRKTPPKIRTPKNDEYVIDTANLLPMELKFIADKQCRKLYKDYGVPMFIITAKSLEDVSRKGLQFDEVAKRFYRFWPLGDEARRKAFQERGVLLMISRDDNLVGLKFGDAWGDQKARDRIRRDIMTKHMIPALQANQLPQAVLNVVHGVLQTAREADFPKPKTPASTAPSTQPAAAPQ